LRPLAADTLAVAVTRTLVAVQIQRIAILVGAAPRRHTDTAMSDIDTGGRGETGVVVGLAVASAYRIVDLGTGVRPLAADAFTVAVTVVLSAIEAGLAVVVGPTLARLARPAMDDIDAGSRGETGIVIGVAVAAAHRIVDLGTGIRPLTADAPTVAVTFMLGTILGGGAFRVGCAFPGFTRTTVGNVDTGNGGVAGIRVCLAVASAYRLEN